MKAGHCVMDENNIHQETNQATNSEVQPQLQNPQQLQSYNQQPPASNAPANPPYAASPYQRYNPYQNSRQPYYPMYQQPYMGYAMYQKPKEKGQGFAVASLIIGIINCFFSFLWSLAFMGMGLSVVEDGYVYTSSDSIIFWFFWFCTVIVGLLSVLFGAIARFRGYRSGLNIAGVIVGVLSIALITTVFFYVAFNLL